MNLWMHKDISKEVVHIFVRRKLIANLKNDWKLSSMKYFEFLSFDVYYKCFRGNSRQRKGFRVYITFILEFDKDESFVKITEVIVESFNKIKSGKRN